MMDMEREEETPWRPFGFHSDDYDSTGRPFPLDGQKCAKALALLDEVGDYLRRLRPSPQGDLLLKKIAAVKAGA